MRCQLPVTVECPVAHVARQRLVCIKDTTKYDNNQKHSGRIHVRQLAFQMRFEHDKSESIQNYALTIIIVVRDGHRLQPIAGRHFNRKAKTLILLGQLQFRKVHSITVAGRIRAVRRERRAAAAGGGHHGHGGAHSRSGFDHWGAGVASVAIAGCGGDRLAARINHVMVVVVVVGVGGVDGIERI